MKFNKLCFLAALLTSGVAFGVPPENFPVRVESKAEIDRMERHLRSLYEPNDVLYSFQHPSGDMIDCVDIYKQPGLRHPDMMGHVILTPPILPNNLNGTSTSLVQQGAPKLAEISVPGGLDKNGMERQCPDMTVPIRRLRLDDIKRFKNLDDFLRKVPSHLEGGTKNPPQILPDQDGSIAPELTISPLLGSNASHQYAHAAMYYTTNYGAHSVFNLWNPAVQAGANEFSLSQLWVVRGTGRGLQSLEAGIQVFPTLYGNNKARLFIYSTSDNYSGNGYASGCYNLTCGRFIQTNNSVIIGSSFSTYSITGGTQREVEIGFFRGGTPTAAWWLYINGVAIGYYPLKLFNANGLQNHADSIDFGGEIVDDRKTHSRHTTTDMGSSIGAWPSAGYGKAAYQRKIWYYPTTTSVKDATDLSGSVTNAYCYDISRLGYDANNWRTYFYFGGPGYNASCQ